MCNGQRRPNVLLQSVSSKQTPEFLLRMLIGTKQLLLYLQRSQVTSSPSCTNRLRWLSHLRLARPRAWLLKQGQWVLLVHHQQESLSVINKRLLVQHHERDLRLQLVGVIQVLLLRLTLMHFVIFVKILDLFNVIQVIDQQILLQVLVRLIRILVQQAHRINRPQHRHHLVDGPAIVQLMVFRRSHLKAGYMRIIIDVEMIEMIVGTAEIIVMIVEEAIVGRTETTAGTINETGAK